MTFFQLITPLSRKIFGTLPNFKWDDDYNPDKDPELYKLLMKNGNLKFNMFDLLKVQENDLFIEKLQLKSKSSKTTNLLSMYLTDNLFVDKELYEIIKNSKVFGMLYYETYLKRLDEIKLKYWKIVPRYEALEYIDYSKTVFIDKPQDFEPTSWKYIKFNSEEELMAFEAKNKVILHKENLTIKENCNCDLFSFRFVFNRAVGFIISERLKEKIEREKMTGMQFLEFDAK